VRAAQQALKDRGFDPGPLDGIIGVGTASALRDFQRSERLPTTGRMDLATSERLDAANSDTRMIW
jgi:membrane-bound lytic murein transglycosylase B